MKAIYNIVAILMLLNVGFHLFETDGACDFEEHHFSEQAKEECTLGKHSTENKESSSLPIIQDHFGHSGVVLPTYPNLSYPPREAIVTKIPHITGEIRNFIQENFRPPLC